MDFQKIVDGMTAMTCVVSVETLPDGKRGKFRLVAGNKAYVDSIEHPAPGTKMLKDVFVPNSEYTDYLTRDLNFEDFCYGAAVEKKCLHSYAHPDRMNVWFNMMFIPLDCDDKDLNYCLYIMEINFKADSERLSNISNDTASQVLDICIKLRGTNDFKATMQDVIAGIRKLCDAEHCCVLVMNDIERYCSVLGESFKEGSSLLPMDTYLDGEFYDIAESWTGTIAGSNCLIVKNDQDMEIIKERNPVWYDSLKAAGVWNIVLFPLKSRNQLLGYIWAINYNEKLALDIKETLEVTTFILGSELGNYLLLDRLRLIGSKDMLTGVLNRNEMNNLVDELSRGEVEDSSVAVIFADLNGLKAVNDLEGHNSGDLLLKNAANALKSVFKEDEIFRAGGDEFAMIVTGLTEKDLAEKIEKVRKVSAKYNHLSFAIGGVVEDNCRNIRVALRRADEKMYEDKKKFYEQFPDMAGNDRRRRGLPPTENSKSEEDEKREQSIFQDMNYDFLTGLPSMTYFFKLAESARTDMHERNIPSVLLFVNMRGLRYYNKKFGFAEGDQLIKELSRVVSNIFGPECCSRFGQDHFAIFAEDKDIEKKLKRIFKEMKTANGGKTLPVNAGIYQDSMGIVETSLACDRAKAACDLNKDDNHSHFVYFDQKMLDRELNRQYVVDNLDRALAENWITAFYQPIVRTMGSRVCDEEALARWIDPEKGMLSPADFIPILEDTRLIYKVDLHILDVIIERIKKQIPMGLPVVPISINLSRTDFECCDIVEEIRNRLDAADVPRDFITVEITESVIGEDLDFMKTQIARFQELGFKVWMDDFGSGYSSLDLLQEVKFDLIKFDMRFMKQFDQGPKSRVLLTELMRMAISLGVETVCEGVETAEQVEFLSEIGCTKLQGYYFTKPLPIEQIFERYRTGKQIGFENPDESEYFRSVGDINLYDLAAVSSDDTETSDTGSAKRYFNTIPMGVVESDGVNSRVARANRSYREFMSEYSAKFDEKSMFDAFNERAKECRHVGDRVFVDERGFDGVVVHSLIRKIADDPVNGMAAYAVAILDINNDDSLTYTGVAEALSADYLYLYQVDLNKETFTEYSHAASGSDVTVERKGRNFFAEARTESETRLHKDDVDLFLKLFKKDNIVKTIDEQGSFSHTYRLMVNGVPNYVNMKIVRMNNTDKLIIGVSNVDGQMRLKGELERLEVENSTYARISALMGDFIAIYTVDPVTSNFMQYSASQEYSELQSPKVGLNFFEESIYNARFLIYPDDMDILEDNLTKEKVLEKHENGEILTIKYRLLLSGVYTWVCLRAGVVKEKDGPQIIVGISIVHEE